MWNVFVSFLLCTLIHIFYRFGDKQIDPKEIVVDNIFM